MDTCSYLYRVHFYPLTSMFTYCVVVIIIITLAITMLLLIGERKTLPYN